jgi:hypothetical protein
MKKFQTSLLREKFVIHDAGAGAATAKPVIALSNRIVAELTDPDGKVEDTLIVRAHNMHSCARLTAQILKSYRSGGSLVTRTPPYSWGPMWDLIISEYEKTYNPLLWAVVYYQGKIVFVKGDHHPFLDVIEKCQASNRGEYERAIPMAEGVFRTMGKTVRIDYDGNVALTLNLEEKQARIGVIVRGPVKTTTFNFSVTPTAKAPLNFTQCIMASAAFLEGIQLSFMIGINDEKIRIGKIERQSKEEKKTIEARQRLGRLGTEITTLEGTFDVRYRPERPDFQTMLTEAEAHARAMFQGVKL